MKLRVLEEPHVKEDIFIDTKKSNHLWKICRGDTREKETADLNLPCHGIQKGQGGS